MKRRFRVLSECQTTDEVQNANYSESYTPVSEHFYNLVFGRSESTQPLYSTSEVWLAPTDCQYTLPGSVKIGSIFTAEYL
jgi:hypothetical protein